MSGNPYLSLIAGLNSDSPASNSTASPEDYSADLSLWTNAEFTFDMPPGLGIFETDSGFADLAASNTVHSNLAPSADHDPVLGHHQPAEQHSLDFLNLSSHQDARTVSLLERTRQRNPANDDEAQHRSELQEQTEAINTFHSLLAAYSAATTQAQLQLQQQSASTTSLPSIAPASLGAPTTPAAAKLLSQPMPQYSKPAAKKQKTSPQTAVVPASATAPSTASTPSLKSPASKAVVNDDESSKEPAEPQDGYELSAADSFSKDDPDYSSKVAAEEDKRRRNTAASARFRQKKKLREQALEQTAREKTARAEALEVRVRELEMEVRWLRGLIVEKDSRLHEATVNLHDANKRMKLDSF
ncbi:hypothetical protein BGZ70_002457 [Mortierella alpina]|uniref:BZIP domain-containing protein n=1 Tax=Mortierella alpina TaxID=64518 RepID=A0A9P6M752_MORAP|nr:hypothetical protein BGZ70_002457 [Mortierella alpina]